MKVAIKPHPAGSLADTVYGGPASSATDVLTRARNALSTRGAWARGAWMRNLPQGRVARCARQAIRDVDGEFEMKACDYLLESIREISPSVSSIEDWNDHKDRTKTEVLDRFDRAIELSKQ